LRYPESEIVFNFPFAAVQVKRIYCQIPITIFQQTKNGSVQMCLEWSRVE